MEPKKVVRKLRAILIADVQGYSLVETYSDEDVRKRLTEGLHKAGLK